jgi:hypothetical protein
MVKQPARSRALNRGRIPVPTAGRPQHETREAVGQGGDGRRQGKDEWGHLPEELRQEMANVFKEEYLTSKFDLIKRYYQSVSQKSLVRGE